MRVWDIPPQDLCRQHLLGEHRELHGLWNILTLHKGKGGYAQHPETLRWIGKLKALFIRHEMLVAEITKRGYTHNSPLAKELATGSDIQDKLLQTLKEQEELLRNKPCECYVTNAIKSRP